MYKIYSIHNIDLINYDEMIKSEVFTNYGLYKSGNKEYIDIFAKQFFNYIINNIDINITNNIDINNEWLMVIPSVNSKKNKRLISLIGEKLKILLDNYFNYNFKILNIYLENNVNNYNYSNLSNYNDRYKILTNNNIFFKENIDLSNKKIILIDDSYIYGVTIKINIQELEKKNINLENLYTIVYIKPSKEILQKYNNFENILNNTWFNNIYNKEFDKFYLCKLIVNKWENYVLTPKNLLYFLTLNNIETNEILQLINNNKLFLQYLIEHFEIYELDNIYHNNYILFKNLNI